MNAGDGEVHTASSIPGLFLMTDSFETGGSERQFAELAASVNRVNFRVQLGCIQRRGRFLEGFGHVPEFSLGSSLYSPKSFWTRFRLAQYLRRNKIAVAHAFDFYTNLTLILAAKLAGVPVVIGSQRQLGDLLSHSKETAQAAMLRSCDAVVCNSHAAANRLIEHGLRKSRVVVIHNGLSAAAFAKTPPALPRRDGVLRVGMIARMNTRSKNHLAFLRAAARLRGSIPNLEFLLVGDGPLRRELELEAKSLGLSGQIFFLGDRRDIPAILASLDVSVLPSASESLSNVILESMAAGLPVVASRVGGNTELVGVDRGKVVEIDNDKALADAIGHLLGNAAMRAHLGRNAKRFVQTNFTLERMRKCHEELYADLLQRKNWIANREWSFGPAPGDRIRLAVVAPSLRYVGGQSVQADLLLRYWQDDSAIEARFIPIDPRFPRAFAWLERIPFLRTIIREPMYIVSLWRGFRNVEIAHLFSASYWSFLIAPLPAWLIARLRGTKVVIHYHSGEARDHLRRFRGTRAVLEDVDRLVVPSNYLIDVFREFGLQAETIPNVVDLSQFTFRERRPLRPRLVCTRGFHPYYCVDLVVDAFAKIQKAHPEAKLDLLGKGQQEERIRALARELGLSGVSFGGAVPHREIARFYDDADIFVNGSSLDNFPVSILEAFACGTPVITTAPEGMSYLVEHERTGLLSEVGDAKALAENVLRLLRNPDLSLRLARNAHEEVRRYSWEAIRPQWLELYRSTYQTVECVARNPISNQTAALNHVRSDRINPESRDSPSMQTRNQSSKFNSRQMRSL